MTEIEGHLKKIGSFPPENGNITNAINSDSVAITRMKCQVS